jgi:hypothetical protein
MSDIPQHVADQSCVWQGPGGTYWNVCWHSGVRIGQGTGREDNNKETDLLEKTKNKFRIWYLKFSESCSSVKSSSLVEN